MDNEKMLKQDNKFVKHIFWDPETKTCYPLYVTIENQQKIQNGMYIYVIRQLTNRNEFYL